MEGVAQRSCSPNQHLSLSHTADAEPSQEEDCARRALDMCSARHQEKGLSALFLLRLPARPVAPDACDLGGGSAHVNVVDSWPVLQCPSSTLTDTEMGNIYLTLQKQKCLNVFLFVIERGRRGALHLSSWQGAGDYWMEWNSLAAALP